ncbi:hypothetical protein [Paraburkholderia sp. SIMBA_030]|uniref:hypothetical protein n=1 Tax=Paraburkholderia sp. SIMBA_030 TaxID=3085773 RepID=UPI00397CE3B1
MKAFEFGKGVIALGVSRAAGTCRFRLLPLSFFCVLLFFARPNRQPHVLKSTGLSAWAMNGGIVRSVGMGRYKPIPKWLKINNRL